MSTLRQTISAQGMAITQQIADLKASYAAQLAPLEAQLQVLDVDLSQLAPWLDQEVSAVATTLTSRIANYTN